ncbi:MAG: MCP four helix bundle domain-containing protein, partial [Oscillospiraceae bacterium]|nr:MCP four helix bundle domain-containing protein [Oscillospiraceae bacterium]
MFKSLKKISTKLIISFIIVTIISSISGILGLFMLQNTDTQYGEALITNGFSQGDIGQFNTYMNKGAALVRDIVLQTDQNDIKASQQELENVSAMVNDSLTRLKPNCQTPEELSLISTIETNLAAYRASRDKVIQLGLKNQNDEAMKIFYNETRPILLATTDAGDQLMALNVQMGNEVSNNLSNSASITMILVIVIIAAAAFISILFAILMAKGISKPIIAVQKAAGQLEQGDLQIDIHTDMKDEIGQMSNSFMAAAAKIRAYINDISLVLSEIA